MRKLFTLTVLFCLCMGHSYRVLAQDARFSQIYASPLKLNPAMTGVYQGKFRVVANYRELYASILKNTPFRTISSSFDMRFPLNGGDYAGFGINLLKDEVGLANFNRMRGSIGGSVLKQLQGNGRRSSTVQYLVAGVQIGLGQRGFDWQNLWFTQQYNVGQASIDFDASNGENFPTGSTGVYVDFNAGALWYILPDENSSFYVGGAIHHINTPNISFMDQTDEKLHRRYVAHMGGELPLSKEMSILPAAAFMSQHSSMSTTAGASFRYNTRDWKAVALRMGGWVHLANKLESGFLMDAFIVSAVLETEKLNFGISYDITTSVLTEANNARGAFELSIIYIHPEKRRNRLDCPKY